jgi:hypothetical protein
VLAYAQRADGALMVFLQTAAKKLNIAGGGSARLERLADAPAR